ncbi:MAG: FtsX-like permease family protein [Promethearchaeota archaeon]
MSSRITFYGKQGIFNLKRSAAIIIGMAITLSMVGGLLFFSNSYGAKIIESSPEKMFDMEISLIDDDPWNSSVQTEISNWINESGLDSLSLFPFEIVEFPNLFYYQNYTGIDSLSKPVNFNYVVNEFNFNLFDSNFYQSEFSSKCFRFIEGTYPNHINEIAIEYSFAKAMNLTISSNNTLDFAGPSQNITFLSNYVQINELSYNFSIENLTISGIFLMKQQDLELGRMPYTSNYEYSENVEEINDRSTGIYNTPILGFKSDAHQNKNHPFIQFYQENSFFFNDSRKSNGYYGFIDPNSIDFHALIDIISDLTVSFQVLEQSKPHGVSFEEYILEELSETNIQLRKLHLNLQYITLPIGAFAILMGSLIIQTNMKGRLKEFLLLRSKGTPNTMIQLQIITESLFMGIIASLIGILGSLGIFYLLRDSVQFALSLKNTFVNLPITVDSSSYLIIGALGIMLSEVSSIISFIFIKKLTSKELLKIIGRDQLEVLHDEKSLFSEKRNETEMLLEDAVFYKSTLERKIEGNDRKGKGRRKFRWRKTTLYKNSTYNQEGQKKSIGWILVLISLIPIFMYFLNGFLAQNTSSDVIMSFSPRLDQIMGDFISIILFTPILFILGLVRIIAIEKPSRLARITNWMAKFLVKENSKICAMNIVRRRAYTTIMIIFGIFISMFSLSQISLQSLVIYENISDNVRIGADLYLEIPPIGYIINPMSLNTLVNNYGIYCNHDVLSLEEQMTDLRLGGDYMITNNIVTIFEEVADSFLFTVYYFNFAKYMAIVSENDKFIPDSSILDKIESAKDYNEMKNSDDSGIIVNSKFLSLFNKENGDHFSFNHRVWNNTKLNFQIATYNTTIIDSIDILPGLYGFDTEVERWEEGTIIFDTSKLGDYNSTEILRSFKLFQLADINPNMVSRSFLSSKITQEVTLTNYEEMSFYNQEWEEFTNDHSTRFMSFLSILSTEFVALGILTALGISILLISTFKNDRYFNGVMLSRGFGKIGIYNFSLVEFLIVFLIPILISIISLVVFVKPILGIANISLGIYPITWKLPIYMNLRENLIYYIFVPFSSIFLFTISFSFTTRKNISEFFSKF